MCYETSANEKKKHILLPMRIHKSFGSVTVKFWKSMFQKSKL